MRHVNQDALIMAKILAEEELEMATKRYENGAKMIEMLEQEKSKPIRRDQLLTALVASAIVTASVGMILTLMMRVADITVSTDVANIVYMAVAIFAICYVVTILMMMLMNRSDINSRIENCQNQQELLQEKIRRLNIELDDMTAKLLSFSSQKASF